MATKTVTTVVDDLDGSTDGVKTVELTLDGVQYQVDLSTANQRGLSDALAPYLRAAHTVGGRRKPGGAPRTTTIASDNATIRSWAQANGYQISSRGRVSAEVRRAFEEANN